MIDAQLHLYPQLIVDFAESINIFKPKPYLYQFCVNAMEESCRKKEWKSKNSSQLSLRLSRLFRAIGCFFYYFNQSYILSIILNSREDI